MTKFSTVEAEGAVASVLEHLSPFDLHVDEGYQRSLNPEMIKAMVANFQPDLFGVIEVNFREDENLLYVIDGQHRVFVARQLNLPAVPCRVHMGMTSQQEAELFVALQRSRRSVSPLEAFHAGIYAGNAEFIAIRDLLDEMGFRIPKGRSAAKGDRLSRSITAVTTVVRVYRFDEGVLLRRSLRIYENAWTQASGAVNGQLLQGLAYLLSRKPEIKDTELVNKLRVKEPGDIMRAARQATLSTSAATVISRVALAILEVYNKGRRTQTIDGSDLLLRANPGKGMLASTASLASDARGMSSYTPKVMTEEAARANSAPREG